MTEGVPSPHKRRGHWITLVAVAAFLVYALWMVGPYLRSVIVRDAAVTSWANLATAPIAGQVAVGSSSVDRVVDADGVVLKVENAHLSRRSLIEAQIKLDLARNRVKETKEYFDDVLALDSGRADLKSQYADVFRGQLDTEINSLQAKIGVLGRRIATIRKIAARSQELASRGTGSEAAADEAELRATDLELEREQLQAELDYARVRREAADKGVFITSAGEDPPWVRGARTELKLAKKEARLQLHSAEAQLQFAEAELKAEQANFARLSEAAVSAPPGSIVWSVRVAPGATVEAGSPLAEWVDCTIVMIDVPVSDAEVSLIQPGMPAEVVLEGETFSREASVLLTRGSASTLGRDDLAAVAKGRGSGVAQVLLQLPPKENGFDGCPVGRAAYVDFPSIGFIDVIRARLRL